MEYFWLDQDKRMPHGIFISNFNALLGRRQVLRGDYSKLEPVTAVFAIDGRSNCYPDVVNKELFMITKPVKQTFELYLGALRYKVICIIDNPNKSYCYYHIPLLDYFDCLSPNSVGSLDKSSFKQIVLKKDCLPKKPVFLLSNILMQVAIVNLEVAESLLRKNLSGIRLSRVIIE